MMGVIGDKPIGLHTAGVAGFFAGCLSSWGYASAVCCFATCVEAYVNLCTEENSLLQGHIILSVSYVCGKTLSTYVDTSTKELFTQHLKRNAYHSIPLSLRATVQRSIGTVHVQPIIRSG